MGMRTMKGKCRKDIIIPLNGMRILLVVISVCLAVVLSASSLSFAENGSKQKVFGFSEEILPINVEEEAPSGISSESFQERAAAKKAMINQKAGKEELMVQLKRKVSAPGKPETVAPATEKVEAVSEKPIEDMPMVEHAQVYVVRPEPIEIETAEPSLGEMEETEDVSNPKPVVTTIPLGSVLLVKNGSSIGVKMYEWIDEQVGGLRKDMAGNTINIEVGELPEELKVSVESLLEVEGVGVEVPGTDYAVAAGSDKAPVMNYDVKDEIFTIDKITLEKKKTGELLVHVPKGAKKDFGEKVLCLSLAKDETGKTVKEKLSEGDIKMLAMVLAEWARYSGSEFKFSKDTDEAVAKAVIRIIGVGVEDSFVRLEDSQLSSKALEDEIKAIVGDDTEAWDSIMEFIYPKRVKE